MHQAIIIDICYFNVRLGLLFEDGVDFELCPCKVASFGFIDYAPPISSFEYVFDEVAVVA